MQYHASPKMLKAVLAAHTSVQLPFDKQIRTPVELYDWATKSNNIKDIILK